MVELNEKAVEAAARAIAGILFAESHEGDAESEWDRVVPLATSAITAYLSHLPAPDDGLVERLLEDAEYIDNYVDFTGSPDRIVRNILEAATALQSKDEQIERMTRKEAESFQQFVDANEARLDAEQQVQKLTAENERLREALNLIDALDPEGQIYGVSHDACRGLIARMGNIARSALETQEGRK